MQQFLKRPEVLKKNIIKESKRKQKQVINVVLINN